MMDRRTFLLTATAVATCPATAQYQPFALRLVRRTGWKQLIGANQCVIGDMYVTTVDFPISDKGTKIGNALELAYRNNLNEISSIPAGDYPGVVRVDGSKGWRIELQGTGSRSNVQIHIGNRPPESIGCILLGTSNSTDSQCTIAGSAAAMKSLEASYADATNRRPIVLLIEE